MLKAIIAHLALGLLLGAGLLLLMQGQIWLLLLGSLIYFYLLIKHGCLSGQH